MITSIVSALGITGASVCGIGAIAASETVALTAADSIIAAIPNGKVKAIATPILYAGSVAIGTKFGVEVFEFVMDRYVVPAERTAETLERKIEKKRADRKAALAEKEAERNAAEQA